MGKRVKLGDVYSFILPNGKYAFARVHQGAAIAVYECLSDSANEFPEDGTISFYVCVYKQVFRNWHYIGNKPFSDEDESWPPPFCWVDQITGKGSIYYRGERKTCTYEECKDLEILAVWDEYQLIDRLMGNPKWQNSMRKPVAQ